jgi:hypothetical protein
VGAANVRVLQVGVVELRPLQVGVSEVGTSQIDRSQVKRRVALALWRHEAATAEHCQGRLHIGGACLQLGDPVDWHCGAVLTGQARWPRGMSPYEGGEHLSNCRPVGGRVSSNPLKRVNPTDPHIELVVADLVDGAGVPLGDLTLLGDTKLLAGLLGGGLYLLAGHLKLVAAGADLPQRDCGTDPGANENQQGSQPLKRWRTSVILESALSLDSRGSLRWHETSKVPADE